MRPLRDVLVVLTLAIATAAAPIGAGASTPTGSPARPDAKSPTDSVVCCDGKPAYGRTTNTDGQRGSGGRAVAYHPGGGRLATPRAAAPDARLFRTGFGGWEPTLGVTRDGTLFYAGRNSNLDPFPLRSRNGGRTWRAAPVSTHGARVDRSSLDPYLWVDRGTGRVFDSDIPPAAACTQMSFSDNQGRGWSTSQVCGQVDHQTVFGGPAPRGAARPSGYPHVVYICAINGGEGGGTSTMSTCEKSLDGGTTFTPTGRPAYPPRPTPGGPAPFCDGGNGHGAVDTHGTIYLPRTWCGVPYLAISRDEGATWKRVRIPGPHQGFDSADGAWPHESGIAVDRHGTLYYDWVAKNGHPYLSVSRDGGRHWRRPADLLPPGVNRMSEFAASIDASRPGKVAAVYMGTTTSQSAPPRRTTWNAYVVTSPDALARKPTFFAASINNPRTNPLWRDGGGRSSCGPLRCGNVGDFLDVVLAPDGTPWAAAVDSCPGRHDRCTDFTTTTPRGEAIVGHLVGGFLRHGTRTTGPSGTGG